jgi:hypothetical protein
MTEDEKMALATFKFGIISEFVTGVKLGFGDKQRLLAEKSERSYQIPMSKRTKISRSTIMQWVYSYRAAGNQIEGLKPKSRADKGTFKIVDSKSYDNHSIFYKLKKDSNVKPKIIKLNIEKQFVNNFNKHKENINSINQKLKEYCDFNVYLFGSTLI